MWFPWLVCRVELHSDQQDPLWWLIPKAQAFLTDAASEQRYSLQATKISVDTGSAGWALLEPGLGLELTSPFLVDEPRDLRVGATKAQAYLHCHGLTLVPLPGVFEGSGGGHGGRAVIPVNNKSI